MGEWFWVNCLFGFGIVGVVKRRWCIVFFSFRIYAVFSKESRVLVSIFGWCFLRGVKFSGC